MYSKLIGYEKMGVIDIRSWIEMIFFWSCFDLFFFGKDLSDFVCRV